MWAQALNVTLGLWLICAPAVLGYEGTPRTEDRITGPIVVTLAVLALRDVTRPARFLLVPVSLWLILTPWLLHYTGGVPVANSILVGLLVGLFAAIRGPVHKSTGGGWAALLRTEVPSSPTE